MDIVKPVIKAKAIADATGLNKVFVWGVLSGKVKPSWHTALLIEIVTGGHYRAEQLVPEMKEWLDEFIKQRTSSER